ncbi:uncharacterized protein LOC106174030 [Lingula anatina]|uniref:Uncharacterized protein LOC106174030 n=1 Tax=Lingula anatina TaxID=7574 RepID=A0A1S3JKA8_LINAN|nr:uncharacterized protein LOC106174030 [Lingula anatina]|eukprot:XP_013410855.1 uncharacterized protein LOC106174030 [Lingula anatina]
MPRRKQECPKRHNSEELDIKATGNCLNENLLPDGAGGLSLPGGASDTEEDEEPSDEEEGNATGPSETNYSAVSVKTEQCNEQSVAFLDYHQKNSSKSALRDFLQSKIEGTIGCGNSMSDMFSNMGNSDEEREEEEGDDDDGPLDLSVKPKKPKFSVPIQDTESDAEYLYGMSSLASLERKFGVPWQEKKRKTANRNPSSKRTNEMHKHSKSLQGSYVQLSVGFPSEQSLKCSSSSSAMVGSTVSVPIAATVQNIASSALHSNIQTSADRVAKILDNVKKGLYGGEALEPASVKSNSVTAGSELQKDRLVIRSSLHSNIQSSYETVAKLLKGNSKAGTGKQINLQQESKEKCSVPPQQCSTIWIPKDSSVADPRIGFPGSELANSDSESNFTNFVCSCSQKYYSLYDLSVHIKETGHQPSSNMRNQGAEFPKLVRGQDMWLHHSPEQTRQILRCIKCGESFRSLPDLTVHMMKTEHYQKFFIADRKIYHKANKDEEEMGNPVFKCKVCHLVFADLKNLGTHLAESGHHSQSHSRRLRPKTSLAQSQSGEEVTTSSTSSSTMKKINPTDLGSTKPSSIPKEKLDMETPCSSSATGLSIPASQVVSPSQSVTYMSPFLTTSEPITTVSPMVGLTNMAAALTSASAFKPTTVNHQSHGLSQPSSVEPGGQNIHCRQSFVNVIKDISTGKSVESSISQPYSQLLYGNPLASLAAVATTLSKAETKVTDSSVLVTKTTKAQRSPTVARLLESKRGGGIPAECSLPPTYPLLSTITCENCHKKIEAAMFVDHVRDCINVALTQGTQNGEEIMEKEGDSGQTPARQPVKTVPKELEDKSNPEAATVIVKKEPKSPSPENESLSSSFGGAAHGGLYINPDDEPSSAKNITSSSSLKVLENLFDKYSSSSSNSIVHQSNVPVAAAAATSTVPVRNVLLKGSYYHHWQLQQQHLSRPIIYRQQQAKASHSGYRSQLDQKPNPKSNNNDDDHNDPEPDGGKTPSVSVTAAADSSTSVILPPESSTGVTDSSTILKAMADMTSREEVKVTSTGTGTEILNPLNANETINSKSVLQSLQGLVDHRTSSAEHPLDSLRKLLTRTQVVEIRREYPSSLKASSHYGCIKQKLLDSNDKDNTRDSKLENLDLHHNGDGFNDGNDDADVDDDDDDDVFLPETPNVVKEQIKREEEPKVKEEQTDNTSADSSQQVTQQPNSCYMRLRSRKYLHQHPGDNSKNDTRQTNGESKDEDHNQSRVEADGARSPIKEEVEDEEEEEAEQVASINKNGEVVNETSFSTIEHSAPSPDSSSSNDTNDSRESAKSWDKWVDKFRCENCQRRFVTKGSFRYHQSRCTHLVEKKTKLKGKISLPYDPYQATPYIYMPLDHNSKEHKFYAPLNHPSKFSKYYQLAKELAHKGSNQ